MAAIELQHIVIALHDALDGQGIAHLKLMAEMVHMVPDLGADASTGVLQENVQEEIADSGGFQVLLQAEEVPLDGRVLLEVFDGRQFHLKINFNP